LNHTSKNSFDPDWISPPGDSIADLLQERNWTQAELASRLGTSELFVEQLVMGKVRLTATIADGLDRILGGSVRFWLKREEEYRVSIARKSKAALFSPE